MSRDRSRRFFIHQPSLEKVQEIARQRLALFASWPSEKQQEFMTGLKAIEENIFQESERRREWERSPEVRALWKGWRATT